MANTSINAATLDFDDIVAAQRAFLKSQSQFRDYDFDGSAMSTLIRTLAYHTYLFGVYQNMATAERFLDSAQIRDSATSKAKELNYLPRSTRSAVAELDLSIPTDGLSSLTIPQGTIFTSQNEKGSFVFVTRESSVYRSSTGTFVVEGLQVYEGSYLTESYVVDTNDETQVFRVSSPGADIDSIAVSIAAPGSNGSTWTFAENTYGLTPSSNVYFLQGGSNSTYEVVFGDNVLGRSPQDGSVVTIAYMVCSGSNGDGCETFSMSSDLGPINGGEVTTPLVIETVSASTGGANIESIASIKRNAPRHFQTQMKASTENDYVDIVLEEFPDVVDAVAFGGENISGSVEFGKVFVAAVGANSSLLTQARQADIAILLEDRNSMGMEVAVVDPEILYIEPTIVVHADRQLLATSTAALGAAVSSAVETYSADSLGRFGEAYRQSVLSAAIAAVDRSVISTEITQRIKKIVSPELQVSAPISVDFRNKISEGVISNDFLSDNKRWRFTDTVEGIDPDGTIYKLEVNPALTTANFSSAGVVDYDTGEIRINAINVFGYVTDEAMIFRAMPAIQTIYANRQDVISIDSAETSITVSAS